MTSPTLPATLETALDELETAQDTIHAALTQAKTLGVPRFLLDAIVHAADDTLAARQELKTIVGPLKTAYPNPPL